MIAGYGKDRTRIVAVRFVEFVVIVFRFAEIIDDVPQMRKE